MKILVVQLLRLGDILLSAPAISGLRRKFDRAEIHVLAFRSFAQVENVLDEDVHWHWVDREALQAAIADPNQSFFQAADLLERSLEPLQKIDFDYIFNLTQTKLSGWIVSSLRARQISGLHFGVKGQPEFGSPWFRYLNDHTAAGIGPVFHYTDLFRHGCEVEGEPAEWKFRRQRPAMALPKPYILLQPLTSDSKKNYPADFWRSALASFRRTHPEYAVGALASPSEAAAVARLFDDSVRILDVPLSQALALMDEADLLVTGDTSIKHLANASPVPVLELSLGSSDLRKTGSYKPGSWILQPLTSCAPCPHASPCSRESHVCAEDLAAEAVAAAMSARVRKAADSENRFHDKVRWIETYFSPMGFWLTKETLLRSQQSGIRRCIEMSAVKLFLRGDFRQALPPFGTEGLNIKRTLQDHFPSLSEWALRNELDFLESEVHHAGEEASRRRESVRHLKPPSDDKVLAIGALRRQQVELDETLQRARIELKLIQSIKSQITASQGAKA